MTVLNHKPGPFGIGRDEQDLQNQFVDLVGGSARADRLDYIWKNSYPGITSSWIKPAPTKTEMFIRAAKRNGFTDREIQAFLEL